MAHTPSQDADVLIVGAGPSGLALALALADAGLRSVVFDAQDEAALADPAPDGRDIALTHRAQTLLRRLGLWDAFPAAELAPLVRAAVFNEQDPAPLRFDPERSGAGGLGHLVANHVIRRVSWAAARQRAGIDLQPATRVLAHRLDAMAAEVTTRGADGVERTWRAPLLVAADSRFSALRRQAGIGAWLRDFGRSVIVCRMAHERGHDGIARECFHAGHTLAVLPLNGDCSSIVVTLPADRATEMRGWPAPQYAGWVRSQLHDQLGAMTLQGERHVYPLVAVYAQRFVAPRFALVGDAAVGMHPVTAHGYNFALYGVDRLVEQLVRAHRAGCDLGRLAVLEPYEAQHRRETLPLYLGTNAVVGLFTDDRAPARVLRRAVIRIADRLPPLKAAIARRLTDPGRAAA
ncbi:MAG: 5-demethoxyubiquinol-8 5-hydroxylase UbiM [Piscinibacter sp.]|nr:5-demethoxyubiquinol-8 5-hydroxylase UbiM [Piscinibacter sp.]